MSRPPAGGGWARPLLNCLDIVFPIVGTQALKVYGDAAIAKFSRKHPPSRRPLQRFLEVARAADWPHFPAVKLTFGGADYASSSGTVIFDVGGNKYRIVARVDFNEQLLFIQDVMTHEEYDREEL